VENASRIALARVQEAFAGEAEHLGLETEQDVVALVKEVKRKVKTMRIMP
jgi:hypothetical protein